MWKLNLGVFIFLCFVCGIRSYSYSYSNDVFKDTKRISTPEDLAQYIENQLSSNETRFISRQCWQHLKYYAKSLVTFKLWAVRVFDASAKFPSGLLRGYGAGLGAFDQCLAVKHESENLGTIRGKYCLGGITLLKARNNNENYATSSNSTGLGQSKLIDIAKGSVDIAWGVCLPDSCSAKDFQILHTLLFMHFSEESCQTKDNQSRELDGGDIAAISILGTVACLMVLSTIYDIVAYYLYKGRGYMILRSFSICTNGSKIITIKGSESEISCIYGLRALSMLLIMYGYRYVGFVFAPLINWLDMLKWITNRNTSSIIDAIVCGDTFLVISGFLVSYNYFKAKERGIKFNILLYYLRRIIRLTPALGMAILIHATLMRHVGSGPVWPNIRDSWLVNSCREHWWSSLLYVQNYVNPDISKICIMQTWQLSVDMQLFILSPLILIPLSRWPRYALSVLAYLVFAAILSPFLVAWVYKLKAIIATNRSLDDINAYVAHYFFPTHTRAASWIIGLLLGYLIYVTNKPETKALVKQKLNIFVVLMLWAVALGTMLLCMMIGREMIGVEFEWVSHAFHMALVRPAWSIAISWIIFACVHGYGGPINSFLSAPIFEVLSRISYGTYLVNFSMLFVLTYQTRAGLEFSDFDVFYRFLGDIIPSLALGLVWTLAFESPLITIGKVIFHQTDDTETGSARRSNDLDSGVKSTDME